MGLGEADRIVTRLDTRVAALFGQLPDQRHVARRSRRLLRRRHRAPDDGCMQVLGECLQPCRLQPERPRQDHAVLLPAGSRQLREFGRNVRWQLIALDGMRKGICRGANSSRL